MNKNTKKKVGIFLPDGIGVRNYLYSGLVSQLQSQNRMVILFHCLGNDFNRFILNQIKIECEIIEIPVYKEPKLLHFIREVICWARLIYNTRKTKNKTILSNFKLKGKIHNRIFLIFAKVFGYLLSFNYTFLLNLEKVYEYFVKPLSADLYELLNIDSLICLHQRSINGIPFFKTAKSLGVNCSTVIFSWDNLPKARLNIRVNTYFVWSKYMKDELVLFYPEIQSDKIIISGTPQFDFYKNSDNIIQKSLFYERYKIPQNVELICFSGDDTLTSPYDPYYLDQLLLAVKDIGMQDKIWILFRPAPSESIDRYNFVISKYNNIVPICPEWTDTKNWNLKLPYFNDVKLLHNIIFHCIGVINIGSTMAIDFGINNKPAAYFNYNMLDFNKWDIKYIYKFQHFKSMNGINPVDFINDFEDLKNWIIKIYKLRLSSYRSLEMEKWISTICSDINAIEIISNNT